MTIQKKAKELSRIFQVDAKVVQSLLNRGVSLCGVKPAKAGDARIYTAIINHHHVDGTLEALSR